MATVLRKVIWFIMLIPAIYLAIVWKHVSQTVPLHFDFKGNVDRYGSKQHLLMVTIIITVLNILIYTLLINVYKIDPRKTALQNKDRLKKIAFDIALYISAVGVMLVYVTANNSPGATAKIVLIGMGILVALLGNNIYNIKPNYFAGVRLPWTLESEDNWRKTHHLTGRLWFFGGLLFALTAFFLTDAIAYLGAATLVILVIVPVLYSYNLYKKSKHIKP